MNTVVTWIVRYREDGKMWTKVFDTAEDAERFRRLLTYEYGLWASQPELVMDHKNLT